MRSATINTRVEPKVKEKANSIFKRIGLSTSDAVNMFLHNVVIHNGIPFDLKIPNAVTLKAINDVEEKKNLESGDSLDDVFNALGI